MTEALKVTLCAFRMVIVLALLSGDKVAGLTMPAEKSATGELSQVPGADQFPVTLDLK